MTDDKVLTELQFIEQAKENAYTLWSSLSKRHMAVCPHVEWSYLGDYSQCVRCFEVCFHKSWHIESDAEHTPWCSLCGRDVTVLANKII